MGEWAVERGIALQTVAARDLHDWPDPGRARAVVALGSDRSVHASPDTWIAAQVGFLGAAHAAGVPVLGICFGAQALATALGGTVVRAARPEIGWVDVEGDAPGIGGRWFSWHDDVITAPPGAEALAASAHSLHAFAIGASVGVQFHPEVTPAIVADWVGRAGAELRREQIDAQALLDETAAGAVGARDAAFGLMDRIAERW